MKGKIKFIIGLIAIAGIAGYFYWRKKMSEEGEQKSDAPKKDGIVEKPFEGFKNGINEGLNLIFEPHPPRVITDPKIEVNLITPASSETGAVSSTGEPAETDTPDTPETTAADNNAGSKAASSNEARQTFTGTTDHIGGYTHIKKVTGQVYEI